MEKRLFRFHSGSTVFESVKQSIEIRDLDHLKRVVYDQGFEFKELTVQQYGWDARIGWDTYLVSIDGCAVGYTNGPLEIK